MTGSYLLDIIPPDRRQTSNTRNNDDTLIPNGVRTEYGPELEPIQSKSTPSLSFKPEKWVSKDRRWEIELDRLGQFELYDTDSKQFFQHGFASLELAITAAEALASIETN